MENTDIPDITEEEKNAAMGEAYFLRGYNYFRLFSQYGNSVNTYSFASALNGLATVANSVIVNGNFKEWHTHLILPAVPSLDEFLYHVIIDTATADE